MRSIPVWSSLLLGLVFLPAASGNEKEARALVDKAIKAHGGASRLQKALQCTRTDTGHQVILSREVPFVSQVTRSLPDRVRLQIELDKKITTTLVLDGNRGWQSEAGAPAVALPAPRLREMREEAYVWWLTTLVPLTTSGVTLSSLDPIKIDGEPALGIKVTRRGYADTKMYFLQRNGLLAKIERRVNEGGRDVDKEYIYSSYKEFDGLTLPTKEIVKVNKDKYTEFTISNYRFPDKLGAAAFARP